MLNGWVNYLFGAEEQKENEGVPEAMEEDWILVRGSPAVSRAAMQASTVDSGRSSPVLVPDVVLESMNGSVTSDDDDVERETALATIEGQALLELANGANPTTRLYSFLANLGAGVPSKSSVIVPSSTSKTTTFGPLKATRSTRQRQLVQHIMFSESATEAKASELAEEAAEKYDQKSAKQAHAKLKRGNHSVHASAQAGRPKNRSARMKGMTSGANNDRKCQKNF